MAKIVKNTQNQDKESFFGAIYEKFKQRPGIYIGSVLVLILVTVTFIGGDMLSGGFGMGSQELNFGYYDKIPIAWVQGNVFTQNYERAFQEYQYYAQQEGRDVNDPVTMKYIWRWAYEETVVHTAILQMMKKSHYLTPEKAVNKAVMKHARFQDKDKNSDKERFSPSLYKETPEATRITIWRQTQDALGRVMFSSDYYELLTSNGESEFIAKMSSPLRSFDMVSFNVDDYPESEFIAYAKENINLFSTIHMSRITVTGEKEAKRILASIKDGTTTFEEAASVQSLDVYKDKGGDMSKRFVFELKTEIPNEDDRDKIINLAKGELSDVIKVWDSWAFFRIDDELTPPQLDDTSVMDRIRIYARNYARFKLEDWAIQQADDFIAQAKENGFRNAAGSIGKEVNSFGPLPINYGGVELFAALRSLTISGIQPDILKEMERNEKFWKLAFKTPLNTPSEPLVQGSNVFVFYPTEEKEEEAEIIEKLIQDYPTQWVKTVADRSLQSYFVKNEKMDDRFEETYRRIFR